MAHTYSDENFKPTAVCLEKGFDAKIGHPGQSATDELVPVPNLLQNIILFSTDMGNLSSNLIHLPNAA